MIAGSVSRIETRDLADPLATCCYTANEFSTEDNI